MDEKQNFSRYHEAAYGAMEDSTPIAKEKEMLTPGDEEIATDSKRHSLSYKYESDFVEEEEPWLFGLDRFVGRNTKRSLNRYGNSFLALPWHTIKIAVITTFFVACLAIFAMQEAPDEHPVSHLAAVSSTSPLYHDLDWDEPVNTVKVYVQMQEIVHHREYHFPDPTIVTVQIQGGIHANESIPDSSDGKNENYDWVELQAHDFEGMDDSSETQNYYFYLTSEDLAYPALRVRVTTNSDQAVGLKLKVLQLGEIVRYEVLFGIILLVLVYLLIIFELVHRTVAALLGSFWGLTFLSVVQERPGFLEVITWIDYDTIGLLFGMMVLVGIFSATGFFEWSAVKAYKLSRGNIWHLVVMLCLFTAATSSFLDNVTTILLVTPVTLRLCRVIDLNPLPVVLAEVIFSNIGGTATGIGDPPNILIISNPKMRASGLIDFATFTIHVAPGAVLALIATLFFVKWAFGKQLSERAPVNPIQKEIDIWFRTIGRLTDGQGTDEERVVREKLGDYVKHLQKQLGDDEEEEEGDNGGQLDVAALEAKYKITDFPLFIKTCAVLGVVIILLSFRIRKCAHPV
jgi:hypothetical protein